MDQPQLPEWIDFEMETPQIDIDPLVAALRQRKQKPQGGIGGAMSGGIDMPKMGAGAAKGGQSSL